MNQNELKSQLASAELKQFKEDYLVAVYRIWDCYAKEWYIKSPYLLRFETNDVLIFNTSSGTQCVLGAVDTTNPGSQSAYSCASKNKNNACLCWREDAAFNSAIGCCGKDLFFNEAF